MGKFHIDANKLCWIDGSKDNPEDRCLHGHAVAYIGREKLEYDCTVSATALFLLKTTDREPHTHEGNQMLPCCGHFYVPDKELENVYISGCDNGIDWTVKHNGNNVILILENGTEMPFLGFGTYLVQEEKIILDALASGYRHIDTARRYENEKMIGNALQQRGIPRRELFLTSKVLENGFGL